MKKTLELDDCTARKLYATAAPEIKTILEQSFGCDFFKEKITDHVKTYRDVCEHLRVSDSDCSIKIEVEGFSCGEISVAKNLIKKMRICKVLNEGWVPKRGERRWYAYWNVSSGFVFLIANCDDSSADSASASALCFKTDELARHYAKYFEDIEKAIIDLR